MANIYPGSKAKSGVFEWIISQMPPHTTYIEGCLGSGQIARRKRPAYVNYGIESNEKVIDRFHMGSRAIPHLQVIRGDVIAFLANEMQDESSLVGPAALVYLDPPYVRETRLSAEPIYGAHEWTLADHERCLEVITKLRCYVMISGYRHELYDQRLASWRRLDRPVMVHRGIPRVESLWCNFPEPFELHDYRYLAPNPARPAWRERERLKKKKTRWLAKLAHMPAAERYAMLAAIEESRVRSVEIGRGQ